jgi:tRNA (guanine-N7-)-methyltransferase
MAQRLQPLRVVLLMSKLLKDYPAVSLAPEAIQGKIDFENLFGRSSPVHVEIGPGKAAFLLGQARAYPELDFLGIEWTRKYYRYAVDRVGRWGLTNIRLIRTDAICLIAENIPDGSIDCYHIYFPDPWPKKRHHKRRLFCPENLRHLLRTLKTGGTIQVATDFHEYFQVIETLLRENQSCLCTADFIPAVGAKQGELVGTNFERKYRVENRPVYSIAVKKT